MRKLMSVIREESGVTAIEYGLIAALVATSIVGGLTVLGPKLGTLFTTLSGSI